MKNYDVCKNPVENSWLPFYCPSKLSSGIPVGNVIGYGIYDKYDRYVISFEVDPNCSAGYNISLGTCIKPPCPESDLTVLKDPDTISFEAGNRVRPDKLTVAYKTKLSCIQKKISGANASSSLTSAWRPSEYQRHLGEIVEKDKILTPKFLQAFDVCLPLRKTITNEMQKHSLRSGQPVAAPGLSRHESGQAFDLTPIGVDEKVYQTMLKDCNAMNTAVSSEPWHIQ